MKKYSSSYPKSFGSDATVDVRFVLKGLIYIIYIEYVRPNSKDRNANRVFEANEKNLLRE